MRAALPALLVLAACAAPPDADAGGVLRGEVVSVDAAPLAYDGDVTPCTSADHFLRVTSDE